MSKIIAAHTIMGAGMAVAAEPVAWPFTDDTLANGMRVIIMEDHRTPLASVQIWFHVGSKNEDPQRNGFAHMFEHMMFRGTDRIGPQDHFKYLHRVGAEVNGYTTFDRTVYWETVPAASLDLALWLEAERMGRLKINEEYFAAEREIVKEERRMRYLNRPYGQLSETLHAAMFTMHPYRWTTIGNLAHLNAATADELRKFFETYYVPNNATLVVVGDVKGDEVLALARKYFEPIARRPDPPQVTAVEPPVEKARRVEITDRAPLPMVVLSYLAPSARSPEAIPLDILSRILSSGQSSRFYLYLVKGQKLAVQAVASDDLMEQAGMFTLQAVLRQGVTVEQGEQALLNEIRLLIEKGIDPEELEKAKNQAVAEYVKEAETVRGKASQLGFAAVMLGDPHRVTSDLARKRAVTADEVVAAAKAVLDENRRVTVVVRPDSSLRPAEEAADKGKAPEKLVDLPAPKDMPLAQSPKPAALPAMTSKTLANGLQVRVLADHSLPEMGISFNMLTGARSDPDDQAGLAVVTAETLRMGTKRHTGNELARLIDLHAMSLNMTANQEDSRIGMWALSEDAELAVGTLAEVVREPTFPDAEVKDYLVRDIASEKVSEQDPPVMASRAFAEALFGRHYLARQPGGTSKTLAAIDPEAVRRFHETHYAPGIGTLMFTGDIAPERAFQLAEKYFGDWNAKVDVVTTAAAPPVTDRRIVLVDRPGAVQSEIRIGQIVPVSRTDADYAEVRLLSQVFGESFGARLNRVLRIEMGLTYGARGAINAENTTAALTMSTFTRTDKTAEAVAAALAEVEKLTAAPITADELRQARDSLIGRFQMALETPAQIAARYWDLTVWGLPENWYSVYLRAVERVQDPAKTVETARRVLQPKQMLVVVVGNAEKIRGELAKIAPVASMPAEEPPSIPETPAMGR